MPVNIFSHDFLNNGLFIALIYKAMVKKGLREADSLCEKYASEIIRGTKDINPASFNYDNFTEKEYMKDAQEHLSHLGFREYFKTPDELIALVNRLFDLKDNDTLFDLGACRGEFLLKLYELNHDHIRLNYKGIEMSYEEVRIISLINVILKIKLDVTCGSLLDYKDISYNKGYAFPPLDVKFKETRYSLLTERAMDARISSEWVFADKLISGLDKEGKAIVLMSNGALYNYNNISYRNDLLEKGYIEGIIELPAKPLENSLALSLVIFSEHNKEVKLCDAGGLDLKKDDIYASYLQSKSYASLDLINMDNILPSKVKQREDIARLTTSIKLGDVASVINGCQYTLNHFTSQLSSNQTGTKILTSKDIDDGYIDWLHLQNITLNDNKLAKYFIRKNDIIVTSKSSKVKIAVVNMDLTDNVVVTGGMLIIRPDINQVDPTFIKMYLDSKDGQILLSSIQKGNVITMINAKDLSQLCLPNISLEKEQALGREYNTYLNQLISLKEELNKTQSIIDNLYDNNLR